MIPWLAPCLHVPETLPHAHFGVLFLLTWLKGIQVCKQDHVDLLRDKGTNNELEKMSVMFYERFSFKRPGVEKFDLSSE